MAKYMMTWNLPPNQQREAIKRFTEGSTANPPEGVTMHGRWHAVAGELGWILIETDDLKPVLDWVLHWSDIIHWQAIPVVDDDEVGEVLEKHFG